MLSRKTHIAVAEVLADAKREHPASGPYGRGRFDGQEDLRRELAFALARCFEDDNPAFSTAQFLIAADAAGRAGS